VPDLPPDAIEFQKRYMALPRAKTVPSLTSFLDAALFEFMPRIAILDMLGPDDFKFRYFGTILAEVAGVDYTGISARESRAQGVYLGIGSRGWDALNHPCGYLSRREVHRFGRPEVPATVLEILTLALPLSRPAGAQCLINYFSVPSLATNPGRSEESGPQQRIFPMAWVDIGAGVPRDTPLSSIELRRYA
jgi:hypothetical protein